MGKFVQAKDLRANLSNERTYREGLSYQSVVAVEDTLLPSGMSAAHRVLFTALFSV